MSTRIQRKGPGRSSESSMLTRSFARVEVCQVGSLKEEFLSVQVDAREMLKLVISRCHSYSPISWPRVPKPSRAYAGTGTQSSGSAQFSAITALQKYQVCGASRKPTRQFMALSCRALFRVAYGVDVSKYEKWILLPTIVLSAAWHSDSHSHRMWW